MSKKILIIEDDVNISNLVSLYLKKEGYLIKTAIDGLDGVNLFDEFNPDLVVLDLMLPSLDGMSILRKIREKSNTYVILLSAKSEEFDKVLGLEVGADDYITKPFSPKELVSRVKAKFRRSDNSTNVDDKINVMNLDIFPERYEVMDGKKSIALTKTEFNILLSLAKNKGKVFSRDEIMDKIYTDGGDVIDRTVDVHITNLRKKINDKNQKIIKTVKGVGYKI